jgi:putative flippase GtrA
MRTAIRRLLQERMVRFVITGGSAATLFYVLTFAFLNAGATPFWGTLAAYAVAFLVSYTVQHAWTFGGRHLHSESFPRYLTAQILCAVTTGIAAHTAGRYGLAPAVVPLATTLIGSAMSYGLSRFWVFADRAA